MFISLCYGVSIMPTEFFDDRLNWDERFMANALLVAMGSSCLMRRVGAVIVKDKRVIGSGYNGAAPGVTSCREKGKCLRKEMEIESGRDKDYCQALHAEMNSILNAGGRSGCNGNVMYSTTFPCTNCSKSILGAGIDTLYYLGEYDREEFSLSDYTLKQGKVKIIKVDETSLDKICSCFEELDSHIKSYNFRLINRDKYLPKNDIGNKQAT